MCYPEVTWRLCLYTPYLIEMLDCEVTKLFKSLTETQAFKHFSQTQSMQSVLRCEQRSVFSLSKNTMGTTVPFYHWRLITATCTKEMGNLSSCLLQSEVIHLHIGPFMRTSSPLSKCLSLSGEWCLHSSWNQDILQPKMGKMTTQ